MPNAITIPRLGWSMEEGTFVRWLKKDGDPIQAGDAIFELEGEKAAQDIEAVDSGILRIPADAPKPGTVVAVGATIGYLVGDGEPVPQSVNTGGASAKPIASSEDKPKTTAPAAASATPALPAAAPVELPAPVAAPSVRRLAREKGISLASLAGSGPAGRIMADDVKNSLPSTENPPAIKSLQTQEVASEFASPRARRIAREMGVDWRLIKGTGRNGRVREQDVRGYQAQPSVASNGTSVFISSRRRTIANRMLASRTQTASVTLTTRVDATNLVGLRQQFKQSANGSLIPSYSDIIMKLVALTLQQHPLLGARADGDGWTTPETSADIHIGFAVDTDGGLVVPVVKDAGRLGLFDLAKTSLGLIEKARSGSLTMAEMQGGVFTITNLGSFGIDAFTPIINLPETAILGLGRIRREPTVIDDQIVARDQLTLSLTFDHRIVDGAPAARFLQTVSQAIENPSAWLLRGV